MQGMLFAISKTRHVFVSRRSFLFMIVVEFVLYMRHVIVNLLSWR